jgi:hypothetical protein
VLWTLEEEGFMALLVTSAKANDSHGPPPLRSADAVAVTLEPLRGPSVTVMVEGAPFTVVLAKAKA